MFLVFFFRYGKKLPYVVTRDVCLSVPSSVQITLERGFDRSAEPIDLKIGLTLTGAEGRFRLCLPVLQNPQQFSDELQNYTLHFTHTHRTLC